MKSNSGKETSKMSKNMSRKLSEVKVENEEIKIDCDDSNDVMMSFLKANKLDTCGIDMILKENNVELKELIQFKNKSLQNTMKNEWNLNVLQIFRLNNGLIRYKRNGYEFIYEYNILNYYDYVCDIRLKNIDGSMDMNVNSIKYNTKLVDIIYQEIVLYHFYLDVTMTIIDFLRKCKIKDEFIRYIIKDRISIYEMIIMDKQDKLKEIFVDEYGMKLLDVNRIEIELHNLYLYARKWLKNRYNNYPKKNDIF